jgi:hypothetical protein
VYRRSLFQRPLLRLDCSTRGGGPQGPRRPRFSFFRFTCQTARDRGVPLSGSPGEPSKPKPPTEIGCWSPNISEELRRRVIAPRRRRTVFAYIGRRRGDCQQPDDGFLGNRSGGRSILQPNPYRRGMRVLQEGEDALGKEIDTGSPAKTQRGRSYAAHALPRPARAIGSDLSRR